MKKASILFLALLSLFMACAKQSSPPPAPARSFLDTPLLAEGTSFFINDIQVESEVLNDYLTQPWSILCASESFKSDTAELEKIFFADAISLMQPLVRAEILMREAQSQFAGDVELKGIAGEELRRQYLRKLHEVFGQYAVVISENEVQEYYNKIVLETLPSANEREQEDFSYEYIAPMLRQKLEKDAVKTAEEKWIDEQLVETTAILKLRNGAEVIIY
ncbi:MAG: hypothetical protein ACI84O_000987 [Myxococcota bacterium]|jgi:hypothetical protein